jgi:hypothetical protein
VVLTVEESALALLVLALLVQPIEMRVATGNMEAYMRRMADLNSWRRKKYI